MGFLRYYSLFFENRTNLHNSTITVNLKVKLNTNCQYTHNSNNVTPKSCNYCDSADSLKNISSFV